MQMTRRVVKCLDLGCLGTMPLSLDPTKLQRQPVDPGAGGPFADGPADGESRTAGHQQHCDNHTDSPKLFHLASEIVGTKRGILSSKPPHE